MSSKTRTAIIGVTVAGFAGAILSCLMAQRADAGYEEPVYSVISAESNIEVRAYPSLIAAEVSLNRSGKQAANDAFRVLAGYIFGNNKTRAKLSMTVPVIAATGRRPAGNREPEKVAMTVPVTTTTTENSMTMRFFMPAKYQLETLPEPIDKRVMFKVLTPRKYATVRFSGLATSKAILKNKAHLEAYMQKNLLQADGEPITAFYNAPWTLPMLRRNEIWIPVK